MKKIFVLALFTLSLCSAVTAAGKQPRLEEFTSVEELALALSSFFPEVQGEVSTVREDRITLTAGRRSGLTPGMALTLWREGKEILHPVTNEVIGRIEDEVGALEIVTVDDASSSAIMKKKLMEPEPGDRARITPRKINAALVPLQQGHSDIIRSLAGNLDRFGRFNMLEQDKVDVFIGNANVRDQALIRELGSALGLDAVATVGIYPSSGKLMVTARIFYTEDAGKLDATVAMLDLKPKASSAGEIRPYVSETPEKEVVTGELPFVAEFFLADDLEGDGRLEYVFSDGVVLHIYRNEPSGWREVWTETAPGGAGVVTMEWRGQVAELREGTGIQHVNIDSADVNGNGRPEIFVTALLNGKVVSYVVEFRDGAFRRTADIPGFLRVAELPSKGTVLLGQAYDPASIHAGKPREYVWSDGKYQPGSEVPIPSDLGLYGWTFARLGEKLPLLAALDDDDHLLVYAGETLLWKSAEQYRAVDKYVFRPAAGIEAVLYKAESSDKSRRLRLRGRVLAVDVDNDGTDEIIVPKNTGSSFIGGLTGAELRGLDWTGARLDPSWNIRDIPGPVFDVRLSPHDKQGARLHALVRTKGTLFTRDRQQIFIYPVH